MNIVAFEKCGDCGHGKLRGHNVAQVKVTNALTGESLGERYLHKSRTGNGRRVTCFTEDCNCTNPKPRLKNERG